ncbi:MAG: GAF domain-containing protein [Microscillaceae bacterium]|nr:GAF domain-containing protein [Microscillaceae bacterium]
MKHLKRKKIARKIGFGYAVILALMLLISMASFIVLRRSIWIDRQVSTIYQPSLKMIDDLSIAIKRSERLSNNWIYQPNPDEKNELIEIQAKKIPELRRSIQKTMIGWNLKEVQQMNALLPKADTLVLTERMIAKTLKNLDDYDNDIKIDQAIQILEGEVQPKTTALINQLERLSKNIRLQSDLKVQAKSDSFTLLEIILVLSTLAAILIGSLTSLRTTTAIVKPLNQLRESLIKLGKGELQTIQIDIPDDEVGDMIKASNVLVRGLERTAAFAREIEKGNFDTQDDVLSQIEVLDNALLAMRDSLLIAAQKEKTLKWAAEGQARLSEIMRNYMSDIKQLSQELLSALIQYIRVELGGIFILNDSTNQDETIYLDLKASYAYSRKKFIKKQLEIREGVATDLVAQTFLECKTVNISQVPQDYIKIISGFGESTPTQLVLVPLVFNEENYGVIEIASVSKLEDYKITFLEKVAESFASTLAAAKINEKTKRLLEESQAQTEQLRAQEEEMRQNMEELHTTQETMAAKQRELEYILLEYNKQSALLNEKEAELEKLKMIAS